MIVTAMLNWYDEPVALLREAVKGAAVIADRLVAADGAYELVEDKRASSPPAQRRAIRETAEKYGLEVKFLKPRIWSGQVAKRDAVLKEAAKGSDWVFVVDADWKITGNREEIRKELEELHKQDVEQVVVWFVQPDNAEREPQEKFANIWHERETDQPRQMPFIYRSMPEMDYQENHWSLFARTEDDRYVGLFGGFGYPGYEAPKAAFLKADHRFEHRCLFREKKQILRNRQYIGERDALAAVEGHER